MITALRTLACFLACSLIGLAGSFVMFGIKKPTAKVLSDSDPQDPAIIAVYDIEGKPVPRDQWGKVLAFGYEPEFVD